MDENISGSLNAEHADDSEIVTLSDVVETEQELLADACAVLGACDDKNCTYGEGYLKRQALYACLTCLPEARTDTTKRAGICLACTFHCHDGHELVELYTKRSFRCDCGNSKFPGTRCNLHNEKDAVNELNVYNQNFSGVYCVCHRPYPDPEDSVGDEMIQCVICEDWFHSRHLGVEPPSNFQEMICESCVKKHDFLLHYDGLTLTKISNEQATNKVDVGAEKKDEMSTSDLLNKILNEKCDSIDSIETITDPLDITNEKSTEGGSENLADPLDISNEQAVANMSFSDSNNAGLMNPDCKMPKIKSGIVSAKFFKDILWRQQLCTCESCLSMYDSQNIIFLIKVQDTVQVYEDRGKALAMENELNVLNSVDRVPLMEAIAGYNDMKRHLIEYLKKFAENKKVVREEDIREFFSSMDARKRQRTVIPYFCR